MDSGKNKRRPSGCLHRHVSEPLIRLEEEYGKKD